MIKVVIVEPLEDSSHQRRLKGEIIHVKSVNSSMYTLCNDQYNQDLLIKARLSYFTGLLSLEMLNVAKKRCIPAEEYYSTNEQASSLLRTDERY